MRKDERDTAYTKAQAAVPKSCEWFVALNEARCEHCIGHTSLDRTKTPEEVR